MWQRGETPKEAAIPDRVAATMEQSIANPDIMKVIIKL